MDTKIDGITLEVIRNAFQSVAEEMGITLIRTSHSPNIKDRMDASTAIYTSDGRLIAQAEHIPLHLGLMPSVVEKVLKIFPKEKLYEGDTILINDPFISGSHLPDIFMLSPVFYNNELIAIVGNVAHHVDVGGMVPGSSSTKATEIFQEGFRIPGIKISKKGVLDEGFIRLFRANTRSKEVLGDLYAQLATNEIGVKRTQDIFKRYGTPYTNSVIDEILNYSDRRMKAAIKNVPNGTFEFSDFLEGDGINDQLVKISAKVIIEDEEIIVDFEGTDEQAQGPINSTEGVTKACSYYVIKSLLDAKVPPNAGTYRSIKVKAPKGTVVHAKFPAAVSNGNVNTSQRIVDTLLGAFSQILPEKVMAACSGSMNGLAIGGYTKDTDTYFSYIETYGGGQGAMKGMDGMDGVHTNMTNTKNTPVEVIEQSYPFIIKSYSLAEDSGGNGKYRGGMGMIREILFECDKATIALKMERSKNGPWGLFGGENGDTAKCFLTKASTGEKLSIPVKSTFEVGKGDVLYIQTAGGGGYLKPEDRDKDMIQKDLNDGFVTKIN